MTPILLNASLTTDGMGYIRRLQFEFATKGKTCRHPCDSIDLRPGMTRAEVASALRTAANKIEKFRHDDEERPVPN